MHSAAPTQPAPDSIPPLSRLPAAEPARRSSALRLRAEAALLAHPWVLALLERPLPQRALTTHMWVTLSEMALARPGSNVIADESGCPLGHGTYPVGAGWACDEPGCSGVAVLCGECHELHDGLVSTAAGPMCALCVEMAYACADAHGDEQALSAGAWS